MSRKLVIVESPAKARTIASYLGSGYEVEASVGHIRDLPQPSELPADMKKGPFGKFAVDVTNGFEPYYVVDADKKKKVAELKRLLKDADELFLATDEDREGEAIAWHLLQDLKPKVPVHRMVFHEITPEAIARALENTRDLDTRLVDAQETRRILDRLYGYEVSPVPPTIHAALPSRTSCAPTRPTSPYPCSSRTSVGISSTSPRRVAPVTIELASTCGDT